VTPRAVRSPRVLWIETADTSAIGTTPTTRRAARTLCQHRGRRNAMLPCLLRARSRRVGELCGRTDERTSHPNGCHSYRKRASTRRSADQSRAATCVAKKATKQPFGGLQLLAIAVGHARALAVDAPPALETPKALVADPQAGNPAA